MANFRHSILVTLPGYGLPLANSGWAMDRRGMLLFSQEFAIRRRHPGHYRTDLCFLGKPSIAGYRGCVPLRSARGTRSPRKETTAS